MILAIWALSAGSQRSDDSISEVEATVESVKRTSENEAVFRVHTANLSKKPVFAFGMKCPKRSDLYPIYLEHQAASGSWEVVTSCVDTASPNVLRIDPSQAIEEDVELKNPLPDVACKKREVSFDGLFRFRLNYFETEKSATSGQVSPMGQRPNSQDGISNRTDFAFLQAIPAVPFRSQIGNPVKEENFT
jgi:hypothetical protein